MLMANVLISIIINNLIDMLLSGEKKVNYMTVPSSGLYLESIEY